VSHRPYPSVDRARNQLGRHYPPAPVVELECLRPMVASFAQLRASTRRAVEAGLGVDTYRLSTRPGRLSVSLGRVNLIHQRMLAA